MGFDSLLDEFSKENAINTTPTIVTETIEYGAKLVNTDYLPEISKVEMLKPYLHHFKHMNLFQYGWRFQFGSDKSWAGLCSFGDMTGLSKKNRNIYVSIDFVKHDSSWKKNMRDVILHEISHAIVAEIFTLSTKIDKDELHRIDDLHRASKGHGLLWKSVCGSIGGVEKHDCRISYEHAQFKPSFKRFVYHCPYCGNIEYGDYPNFTEQCSKCSTYIAVRPNVG